MLDCIDPSNIIYLGYLGVPILLISLRRSNAYFIFGMPEMYYK